MKPAIRSSRALLFPGPQPPLSHFGATLLRHVLGATLRYSFYQLGLPPPDRPPIRIVNLRSFIDLESLAGQLDDGDGIGPVLRAIADPGGIETVTLRPEGRLRGTLWFHRLRTAIHRRPRLRRLPVIRGSDDHDPWVTFRGQLSSLLPSLNDALLGEVIGAMDRRRQRAQGKHRASCLSSEAWRLLSGRRAHLECLGDPDPSQPSWRQRPETMQQALASCERTHLPTPIPPMCRRRGRFRELYRAALGRLRIPLADLGVRAHQHGLVDDPQDIFFLPFDLGQDLMLDRRPSWMAAAVATNRREYLSFRAVDGPSEWMTTATPDSVDGSRLLWNAAPLALLP